MKLGISIMGMARMPLATVTVQPFAGEADWKHGTELVCPQCGVKPHWIGGYNCDCGFKTSTWQGLKRILSSTKEAIVKTRLIAEKEEIIADLFTMPIEEFSNYVDATRTEYGVSVKDETSAKNLKKLIIATEKLGKVILVRYNDTYEQVIGILTLSLSNRVIIKDIIPLNLAEIKETLTVNVAEVTPQELAEAEQLIQMLPKALPEHFEVEDYRTKYMTEKPVSEKVIALEAIIQKAKATA